MKPGTIVIIPDCPPIHGDELKDRPGVLLYSDGKDAVLVACTAHPKAENDYIQLPHANDRRQSKTGLSEISWAVPYWILYTPHERFKTFQQTGYVSGKVRDQIMQSAAPHLQKRMLV